MKYVCTLFFILLFFSSCKKTIDVKLKNEDKKIVIDSRLMLGVNDFNVKVSLSDNFFGNSTIVPVLDASVVLRDDNNTYNLTNIGDGNYKLPLFNASENKNYKLSVNTNGMVYEASSFVLYPIELVDVFYLFEEASIFSDKGFTIYTQFKDPLAEVNYYRIDGSVNGDKFGGVDNIILVDDGLENGNVIDYPVLGELELGDEVIVNLYHINLSTYNYYKELGLILDSETDLVAPTNPLSNWSNNALGNFSTMAKSTKTIVIQ
jgi:hypothetical protein